MRKRISVAGFGIIKEEPSALRCAKRISVAGFALSPKSIAPLCEQAHIGAILFGGLALLTRKKKHHPQGSYVLKNGTHSASSGARTLDTLIKSQVLYQLS